MYWIDEQSHLNLSSYFHITAIFVFFFLFCFVLYVRYVFSLTFLFSIIFLLHIPTIHYYTYIAIFDCYLHNLATIMLFICTDFIEVDDWNNNRPGSFLRFNSRPIMYGAGVHWHRVGSWAHRPWLNSHWSIWIWSCNDPEQVMYIHTCSSTPSNPSSLGR